MLGPDGSGKSTLIEGLRGALAPAFERVLCAHFRPGLERRRKTYRPEADPHGRPPRSAVSSVLKLGFYAADHVAGYVLGTAPARARGALVLYDRHFADLEIDPRRYRYGGPPVLLGATRRLIPQPDLTLILDAPADVIQRRRQEVTPAESARQVAAYRALARRVPRTCLIDAGRPPDQVLRQTAEVVVARVAAQTARRLGL